MRLDNRTATTPFDSRLTATKKTDKKNWYTRPKNLKSSYLYDQFFKTYLCLKASSILYLFVEKLIIIFMSSLCLTFRWLNTRAAITWEIWRCNEFCSLTKSSAGIVCRFNFLCHLYYLFSTICWSKLKTWILLYFV